MKSIRDLSLCMVLAVSLIAGMACGDDDANDQLIGAVCAVANDCDDDNDDTDPLECITTFKGGYCGKTGCAASTDCPEGSLCVTYEQANYCFLVCTDKSQCNQNRPVESESNCSSNVDPIEGGEEKVCVPPSADE